MHASCLAVYAETASPVCSSWDSRRSAAPAGPGGSAAQCTLPMAASVATMNGRAISAARTPTVVHGTRHRERAACARARFEILGSVETLATRFGAAIHARTEETAAVAGRAGGAAGRVARLRGHVGARRAV